MGWQTDLHAAFDHVLPQLDDPARTAGVRALGADNETLFPATSRG